MICSEEKTLKTLRQRRPFLNWKMRIPCLKKKNGANCTVVDTERAIVFKDIVPTKNADINRDTHVTGMKRVLWTLLIPL